MGSLGPGVRYVTSNTSEQIKAGTMFTRAWAVCVLLILGRAESGPTTPALTSHIKLPQRLPVHFWRQRFVISARPSLTTVLLVWCVPALNEPSSRVATPCISVFRIMQCKVRTDAIHRQLFRLQQSLTAFITRTAVRRPWRRGTEDLKCRLDVAPRGRMFAQRSSWLASTRYLLQSRTAAGQPQ